MLREVALPRISFRRAAAAVTRQMTAMRCLQAACMCGVLPWPRVMLIALAVMALSLVATFQARSSHDARRKSPVKGDA